MNERAYYEPVRQWLLSEGCFRAEIDRGSRLARGDVVGVRHVGGDLSTDAEVIAVEVKTDEPFFKAASQAAGYKVFAHRCYLAEWDRGAGDFSREEIEVATSLGIGLIKLRSQRPDGVEPRFSAPHHVPRRRFLLQWLESVGLSECMVCHGLFEGTFKAGVKRADRDNVRMMLSRAIEATEEGDRTGFLFWSEGAAKQKAAAGDSKHNTARRYVCPDCLVNVFQPLMESPRSTGRAVRNTLRVRAGL
jgi:hypothetical protein